MQMFTAITSVCIMVCENGYSEDFTRQTTRNASQRVTLQQHNVLGGTV